MEPNNIKPFKIIFFDRIDSTNTYLKNLKEDRVCAWAKEQLAGRGRMGRQWNTQAGGALTFSVSLFENEFSRALLYPIMCVLAVRRALGNEFFIKWPNDIIAKGKKIAGILCESLPLDGQLLVVCGIGINLSQSEEFFKGNNLPNAGSVLTQTGKTLDGESIVNGFLSALDYYTKCNDMPKIIKEYNELCLNIGKNVKSMSDSGEETGFCEGVDIDGGLIIKTNDGIKKVQSGEVSIRGENGEYI
jgi:BirA family biotin operon repressor/biotin-[acetyl-CoA-carboxylase] ligase